MSGLSVDDWAFGNNIDIKQHRTLEERLAAAQSLIKENPLCPVTVDVMTNVTDSKYGALPERLYVLQGGRVIYKVSTTQTRTQLRHEAALGPLS